MTVNGAWQRGRDGGCMNNQSWANNPKFVIKPNKKKDVTISLSLKQSREPYEPIGFYVFGNADKAGLSRDTLLATSEFVNAPVVSADVNVKGDTGPWAVLPVTFKPGKHISFDLIIQAPLKFEVFKQK